MNVLDPSYDPNLRTDPSVNVQFDFSEPPLLRITYPVKDGGPKEVIRYRTILGQYYEQCEFLYTIHDGSNAGSYGVKTRLELNKWQGLQNPLRKKVVKGMAMVAGSYMSKLMLNMVLRIKKPSVNHKLFDRLEMAETWVRDEMELNGDSIPESLKYQ